MKRIIQFGLFGLFLAVASPASFAQDAEAPAPQPETTRGRPVDGPQHRLHRTERLNGQARRLQGRVRHQGQRAMRPEGHSRGPRGGMLRNGGGDEQRAQRQRIRSLSQEQRDALRERMKPLYEEERSFNEQMRQRARPLVEERRAFREQMHLRRQAILNEFAPPAQSENQ